MKLSRYCRCFAILVAAISVNPEIHCARPNTPSSRPDNKKNITNVTVRTRSAFTAPAVVSGSKSVATHAHSYNSRITGTATHSQHLLSSTDRNPRATVASSQKPPLNATSSPSRTELARDLSPSSKFESNVNAGISSITKVPTASPETLGQTAERATSPYQKSMRGAVTQSSTAVAAPPRIDRPLQSVSDRTNTSIITSTITGKSRPFSRATVAGRPVSSITDAAVPPASRNSTAGSNSVTMQGLDFTRTTSSNLLSTTSGRVTGNADEIVFPASSRGGIAGKSTTKPPSATSASQNQTVTVEPSVTVLLNSSSTTNTTDKIDFKDIINAPRLECPGAQKMDQNGKCRDVV